MFLLFFIVNDLKLKTNPVLWEFQELYLFQFY
jgi:hypothetical protein